eukprot:2238065-Pleurochrysis_carterae.AAC.1
MTNPVVASIPKLTVEADTIVLPNNGIFRFNGCIEYDEQSQLAMQTFLATVLHRMPESWVGSLSREQLHQVQGLARHAEEEEA